MAKNEKPFPPVEGIVIIAHDIHPKSQEALDNVLKWLSEDYDVKDCSKDEYHPHEGYYARLKESVLQSYAKCDYCNHYNTRLASKCHGFSCEKCGKVLYKEYIHRSPIRLYFLNDQGMRYMNFIIHSYDDATQRLLVYAKPQKPRNNWFSIKPEKVEEHLRKHEGDFERLEINGIKLLAFYLPSKGRDRSDSRVKIGINEVGHPPYKRVPNPERYSGYDYTLDEQDQKCHYRSVQLYKGQEIQGDMDWDLPVYASFSVCLTFKHAPAKRDDGLARRIIHAARQVADCGYYYQDGRDAFSGVPLEWMARYVEHFTDLDVSRFRRFLRIARRDGPGFICDLSRFVGKEIGIEQYVENRPNIGNVLVGMSKLSSGYALTRGEIDAMTSGLGDRKTRQEYEELLGMLDGEED